MNKQEIIDKTTEYIKNKLGGEWSGHDWWHVYRVWKNALHICKHEKADRFVVELASLLHDIADWKFHNWDEEIWPRLASEWLESLWVDENIINHVCSIIRESWFKWAFEKSKINTIEWMIVQDADRLDALWAIWIWRTFAYWWNKWREMYNPNIKYSLHKTNEEYKNNKSNTVNHFYEKLFLLKDLMNTKTAKEIAIKRHKYMEWFLDEFFIEWEWND